MNPDVLRFTARPRLENASLIIGWTKDTGAVSGATANYLVEMSGSRSFGRIEPVSFFPVGGVTVEEDIAQFPESRFYYSEQNHLAVLRSDEPQANKHGFLNAVLDLAEYHGRVEALYAVNGVASYSPHTNPRRVFGIFGDPAIQRKLRRLVPADMTWQGPPHTSTYLLWLATERGLSAANLWIEVPFYLAGSEDFQAIATAVSVVGRILGRQWELDELDQLAAREEAKLEQLRLDDPQVDQMITTLEQGRPLQKEEQLELVEAVKSALKGTG